MNYLTSVSHSSWMGSVSDGSPVGVSSPLDAAGTGRGSSLELIDRASWAALGRVVRGERRSFWQRLADWLGVTK